MRNSLAVVALIVSIAAVLISATMVGVFFGLVLGVIGIVVSILALRRARHIGQQGTPRRTMSIIALVLSSVSTLANGTLLGFVLYATQASNLGDCFDLPTHEEINECVDAEWERLF